MSNEYFHTLERGMACLVYADGHEHCRPASLWTYPVQIPGLPGRTEMGASMLPESVTFGAAPAGTIRRLVLRRASGEAFDVGLWPDGTYTPGGRLTVIPEVSHR